MASRWQLMASVGSTLAVWGLALSLPAQTAPFTMPDPASSDSHEDASAKLQGIEVPAHQSDLTGPEEIPVLPPPVNPLQQMARQNKTWGTITSDDILGITPEKKSADDKSNPDSTSRDSDRSPLHDLLQQQRYSPDGKNNRGNSGSPDEAGSEDTFYGHSTLGNDPSETGSTIGNSVPGALFNHLLQNSRTSLSHQFADSQWAGVFAAPPAPPPTQAQIADMAAFREMLNPTEPVDTPKNDFGDKLPVPSVDPNVQAPPPQYNPEGRSYSKLEDNVGRPKKLEALPTATTGGYQAPYVAPSWAPKPPPWTLNTPQLFVEPERHF